MSQRISLLNDVSWGSLLAGISERGCKVVKRITIVTLKHPCELPSSSAMTHSRRCIPCSPAIQLNQPIFASAMSSWCQDKLKITNKQSQCYKRGSGMFIIKSIPLLISKAAGGGNAADSKVLLYNARTDESTRQGWCSWGFVQFNLLEMLFENKYLVVALIGGCCWWLRLPLDKLAPDCWSLLGHVLRVIHSSYKRQTAIKMDEFCRDVEREWPAVSHEVREQVAEGNSQRL